MIVEIVANRSQAGFNHNFCNEEKVLIQKIAPSSV